VNATGNPDNAFQPGSVEKWFTAQPGSGSSSAARIETSGSSTTIVSSTTGSSDLKWVDIGDLILVRDNTNRERVLAVVTNADNDTITVDQAVNLGTDGVGYRYKKLVVRSGLRSGWFSVTAATQVTITINVNEVDADDFDYQVECRQEAGNPTGPTFIAFGPTTFDSSTEPTSINLLELADFAVCRLGLKFATGDTDNSPVDSLDAYVTVRR
jgi:hypothetical protein